MARRGYSQKDQDALKAYHKTAAKKQQEKKRQQERVEQARKSAQRVQTANANKYRRSTDTNKNSGKRTVYYRSKDDPSKTVTKPVKPQTAKQQKSLAYRSKDDAKPVTGKQWNTLKNAKPKTGLQVKQEAARKYERQTGQTYKPRTMQELVTGERIWKPDKRAENRARAEGDAARRLGGDFPLPTTRKKQQGPSTWDMVNRLYDEDEANRIDSATAQFKDPESDLGHRYNAAATAFNTVSVGRDGKLYHHGDQPVTQAMIDDLIPFGTDDEETRKVFESFGFTVKPYDPTKSEAENNIEKSWMRANWNSYDDHGRADDGADQMRMMRNSYAWQKAKERGDTDEMERLHQENERIRAKYGYSGGEDGSEYLRGKTTLAETFDRSSVADAALSNARRRLENATTEEEKKAAQQEIDYILSNPNYKGDAGRRIDLLNKSAYHGAVGGTMQYIQAQRQQANYAASENAWKYWEQEANKVQELQEKLKTLTPNTAEYNKVEQEIRRGEAAAEEMRKLKADPDSPFFDYRTAMDHPEIIQPIYDPKWGNMVRQGQREMEEATEGMGEFGKGASELYVNALEMAPTFAASLIPGVGPVSMAIRAAAGTASLGQMTFAAGGQRYVELVDQGVPLRQAATDAVIAQNIELLTESLPFHMAGRLVTGASPLASSALKAVAGNSANEGAEEIVAGGLNYAWGHGARGYQFDTWSPQDAAKEFLFGAIMGGVHSGAAVAINRGINYLATRGDREGIDYMNARMGDMDQLTERYKNLYDQFQAGEVSQEEFERQTLKIQEDTTSALRQMRDYLKEHGEGAEISDRVRGLAEDVTNRAGVFNMMMNATQQQRPQEAAPSEQSTVPPIVQTADQVKEEEQKVSPAERIQTEAEEAIKAGTQVIQQQQAQEEAAELMDDSGTPAESMASRYQKAAEAARGEQEAAPKGQAEQTTTQTAQNTKTAPSNDLVERYANTMSENGKAAIRAATEGLEGQERSQMAYNFTDTYLKALTGNRTVKPENMTQAQYDAAVQAGVRDKAVRDQQFRDFDATVRKGKVAHSAADVKLLGTDSLKVMRAAADAFGVPVVVVNQSRIAGGENVPEGLTLNGEYRNGVIYLNRDALKKNAKPEDLARFVLGHELTHRLQEVATDEYNKLYEYVMSMPEYRDRVMRVARIRGATSNAVDMAGAADEVVADFVGQLVADSNELQRFITEFREEKGLLQKVLDFLRELASRLVGKHDANLDRSIRLLEDALKAGSEYVQNAQNAQNAPESGKNGTKSAQNARRSGTVVQNQDLAEQAKRLRDARRELAEQERRTTEMQREIERGEGRHSMTTTGEGAGFDVIENKETHMVEFWSDGVKVDYVTPDMLDERGMIGALIKLARDEAGTITPAQARGQMQGFADLLNLILSSQDSEMVWAMAGSALFSAVKANSDKQYKTTIDFGTICVKTQNMIDAMTDAMAELGRGLTKDEIMEIQHDIITEHGTVPCPVCYVFSRWAGVGGLLDNMKRYHYKYLDMTQEQVEQEIKKLSAAQTAEAKEAARNDPDFGPRYRELEDLVKTSEDPNVVKQAKKELKEYEKAVKRRAMIATDEVYANLASEEETTVDKLERVREELSELNRTAKSRRENAMAIDLRRKSRDKFNERIKDLRKAMKEIENAGVPELSWLKRVRVKPDYFEKGVFTDADGNILDGKDLDAILFNLNAADEWASNAPLLWEFRKSRGAGLGKAILPYSDYRFGDLILGDKENSATGKRTFAEVGKSLNKFQVNKYREAVKRTLAQNWMGGQRFQSTSDFRYDYALDYIQAFLELQALGGAMQTYTKVIEFADMVARIGGDVNMSVMPFGRGYDANGKLVFSSVTGMDAGEAWRLRKRTNNAQLILVGINDEHIRIAMEESDASGEIVVDFIIPYHPSGAKIDTFIAQLVTNLEKEFDTSYYQNYEPVQNDVERDDATTEQLRRAALRQQLLTGTQKVGKKSVPWTPSEADMKLINRRSKNIRDRSFEELYDIEDRALRGDKAAIKEYVSWSAGVLGNIYKAFWSEKSIYAQHGVHLTNEQAGQIMPNEYWDQKTTRGNAYINGFIFRSWCYSLGLHPRFTGWSSKGKIGHGDFSKQKGYWKVLIDRRMYDMNGKFRPQRPINITAMTTKEGLADLTPPAEDDPRYQVQTNRGEEGAGERAAKRFVDRKREEAAARWSLTEVDPVEPTSSKWKRGATFEEVKSKHPTLFELDADDSETRNPTQIKGTVSTYRKIYTSLQNEGFTGKILDASSGLGYGTKAGREEFGFDVDDIEPFPDEKYKPRYTDYSALHKKYDVIISNAVLNVIPQDLRDAMTVKIGELLAPGGRAFINVRGTDVRNASSKVAIDEEGMEYFISSTGSYQKGFTSRELVAYLRDALGPDFSVDPAKGFGAVSAIVTKSPSKGRQSYTADSDEEYMDAVERGDMETAQRMVDEAARKAGYNVTGYHGTDAKFNEFKFGDLGYHIGTEAQARDRLGQAGQRSTQKDREDRIMRLYARIRNPLTAAFDFGDWHGKNTAQMLLETEQFEEGYDENAEEINARLEEIARMAEGPYTDKVLREYLQSLGYDGVEYENQFEGVDSGEYGWDDVYEMSYIAFESNQLKLADPVTYDDDGNVIPLSERFNPAKNDVRWSVTEDDRNPLTEAEIEELGDLTEEIDPNKIVPWNGVNSDQTYKDLIGSFSKNGWSGRPVVVVKRENAAYYEAITGSHRVLAAREAGIDVPAVVLDYDEDTRKFFDPIDEDEGITDEEQGEKALAMAERGAIPLSVAKLINREWELNYDNWGVPTLEQERWSISESDTDPLEQMRLLRENVRLREKQGKRGKRSRDQIDQWKTEETNAGAASGTVRRMAEQNGSRIKEQPGSHADEWTSERIQGGEVKAPMPLSSILEKIRHDFGLNITTGHIRGSGVRGQFNTADKGIRSKIANDLPAVSHELGHWFDDRFGITEGDVPADVEEDFKKALGKLAERYKDNDLVSEGLAEFIRKFLTNRETAAIDHPAATKFVLSKLDGQSLAKLLQFADEINAYYSMDADTASSSIRFREEGGPDFRTHAEKIKDMGDAFYQAWIDSNYAIKRLDRATGGKAYIYATNAAYSDAIASRIVTGDLTDINGQYVGPGLKTALNGINTRNKQEWRDFGEYLVVRHGPERLAQGKRVFADDRKDNTSFMNRRREMLEEQYLEFKEAGTRVIQFAHDLAKTWGVDTGLISQDLLDMWGEMYKEYVPLNRAIPKERGGFFKGKEGFANQTGPFHRAKGSGLDIVHPVDNIIDQIVKMVNAGVRNNVMRIIANTAEAYGANATFMEKVPEPLVPHKFNMRDVKKQLEKSGEEAALVGLFDDNALNAFDLIVENLDDFMVQFERGKAKGDVVAVMRNGNPEYWKINDKDLLDSITSMSSPKVHGLLEAYAKTTRFMTANITGNNPIWSIFSNAPRDLATFFVFSQYRNPAKAISGIGSAYLNGFKRRWMDGANMDPLYSEFLALGGGHASSLSADADLARKARKQFTQTASQKIMSAINPINWITFLSDTIEMGPRFAAYKQLRIHGMSPHEAFYGAMDVTVNFRKGGYQSRQVNKAVPFFNASVQGIDKFGRFFSADDVPTNVRGKVAARRIAVLMAVSAAVAAMMYALNNGDDDKEKAYQQLSTYTKNNFFVIPMGEGKFFAIPKPRELAVLSSLFETSLEFKEGGNKQAFYEFYNYATDNFLPSVVDDIAKLPANIKAQGMNEGLKTTFFGAAGSLGILGVGFYAGANRDFLGRPIESQALQNLEPRDRFTQNTSKMAYWIGQGLNVSPTMVDYIANQVLSYVWKVPRALFPVGSNMVDYTLGVKNTYVKDNLYSQDLVNWLYDHKDASARAATSDDAPMSTLITAKNDSNLATFYSRFNKLNRDNETTTSQRSARQTVLDMIWDYQKVRDEAADASGQKAVYDVIRRTGTTDLMPAVMNVYVKNGDEKVSLTDAQYVEYQSLYNGFYWSLAEESLRVNGGSKPEYLLKEAKELAQEKADAAILKRFGVGSETGKYGNVKDPAVIRFESDLATEREDGSLKQEEVISVISQMLNEGIISTDDAYSLFHSRYDSDKNNPWAKK